MMPQGKKKGRTNGGLLELFIGELVRFFLWESGYSTVKVCEFFTTKHEDAL
jgi:hypothetical protein